jgi:hypothetical protein
MKEGFIPTEVELTVWSSMLDGEFTVKVIWSAPYRGELTIADEATVLQREPVSLAYNAQYGPDGDDVAAWQEAAIAFVDKLDQS